MARWTCRWRPDGAPAVSLGVAAILATAATAAAQLAPIDPHAMPVTPTATALRIEVLVNGVSTRLVEPFVMGPDGRLSALRRDLEEAGIRCSGNAQDRVDLATLPRVSYRYDPAQQTIAFTMQDADRVARVYDAGSDRLRAPAAQADWGSVMNYSVFWTSTDSLGTVPTFAGINASLDASLFAPYGTFRQTMITGDTIGGRRDALRLDTTYLYSDPDTMITGEIGDVVSGGLAWTRPFRYAGLQLRRDFSLRQDLVTQPLPNLSGSAAVPSTIDVFLNDTKAYSQTVQPGPYSITNLPLISGNGVARVVVTDATGQQSETALPFFATPTLLAPGIGDYALDVGVARRNYATDSDDYGSTPLGSASLRRGFDDNLTLEAHVEGGGGMANGGIGGVAGLQAFGTFEVAMSGSHADRDDGGQIFGGYELECFGFRLDLSSQRSLGAFADIGSVTATGPRLDPVALDYAAGVYARDARPVRALDRVTMGFPAVFGVTSLSTSFVNLVSADGQRSRIATASLSRPLPYDAALFATAYVDLARQGNAGAFVGMSIPLGPRIRAAVGVSSTGRRQSSDLDVGQTLDDSDGSVGWRLHDQEGAIAERSGEAGYRSGYGTAIANVGQNGRQVTARGTLDGSVGYVGKGGFFVGNRVDDGFAVVDTGVGGVPVYQDNRLVGETNPWGKLLMSDLHAYRGNQVSIDPLALPANTEAQSTRQIVVPTAHAGVGLDFGIDRNLDAALVVFQDGQGHPIAVGSKGHLAEGRESFVVGYAGEAYIRHLKPDNLASIDVGDRDCTAAFAYRSDGPRRVTIRAVTCL